MALRWREHGLPLVIGRPNAVSHANDHSIFGHHLRLVPLGGMPPIAWGGDAVFGFVDVDALTEGLCLAAERAHVGEDYAFSGPAMSLRRLFEIWSCESGRRVPRWHSSRTSSTPSSSAASWRTAS